jgi:hypothetical protein
MSTALMSGATVAPKVAAFLAETTPCAWMPTTTGLAKGNCKPFDSAGEIALAEDKAANRLTGLDNLSQAEIATLLAAELAMGTEGKF